MFEYGALCLQVDDVPSQWGKRVLLTYVEIAGVGLYLYREKTTQAGTIVIRMLGSLDYSHSAGTITIISH